MTPNSGGLIPDEALAHAADLAYAASAPPGGAGGPTAFLQPLLLFGAMFAIFYFIVIRPQQRQKGDRERMLAAPEAGRPGHHHRRPARHRRRTERAHGHAAGGRSGEAGVRSQCGRSHRGGYRRQGCLETSGSASAVVAVVLAISLWYLYPPKQRINLGLDLQGGIHLVLGVEPTSTSARQTERAAEDLKNGLERKGVGRQARGPRRALVDRGRARQPLKLERRPHRGGRVRSFDVRDRDEKAGRFTLAMRDRAVAQLRDDAVRQGVETIRNRVDQFGVCRAHRSPRQGDGSAS